MAIDTVTPVANSVLLAGESFSFTVDDTYTALTIEVFVDAGVEFAYDTTLGGAQLGYTVLVTASGGRHTFTVSRNSGWDLEPTTIRVVENETGSNATTTWSFYLGTTQVFPQSSNPLNPIYTGTNIVSEDNVQLRDDVRWFNYDGASFNLVDNGNGKFTLSVVGGSGSGDVAGPGSATDDAIAVFDGTTGKMIKNSTGTIAAIDANTAKVSYTDATAVGLNTTHRTSDGTDHSDVVANTAKVTNATHTGDVTGATALTIGLLKVVEGMLANDAVTLAKMAGGTAGNIISYDASGDPVAVATGTATHVLTSNGVGLPPTFQVGGGGSSDHGALTGLADDDHTQYLLADGTRTLTDDLAVTALKTIDGRDISVDGTKLDTIATGAVAEGAAGDTHATSDGTDHSDVVTNNAKVTNATHTGDVTGATALTIGPKKVTLSMMEDGVDGELITYDASGVAAKVPVGTSTHVLTSNGAGAAPTFQAATGGGDVNGPASATDDAIAVYDGVTGKLLKDSTGTIAQITANTAKTSNATHTGDVTGDTALTIGAKKVLASMMEDGVDGELFTWGATGVIEKVAVGTATHVLTSNGVGAAPTFQAAAGGGLNTQGMGEWKFDTSIVDSDPGAGKWKINKVDETASPVLMWIDDLNEGGLDTSVLIQNLMKDGSYLYIQRTEDSSEAALYEIAADSTDSTGYWEVTLTFVSSTTGFTTFANNKKYAMLVLSPPSAGGGGTSRPSYWFEHTQESDGAGNPATGNFLVRTGSSGTPSGITQFRFHPDDINGDDQSTAMNTVQQGTHLKFWKTSDPTEWFIYRADSLVAGPGASSWTLGVAHVADSGDILDETSDYEFMFYVGSRTQLMYHKETLDVTLASNLNYQTLDGVDTGVTTFPTNAQMGDTSRAGFICPEGGQVLSIGVSGYCTAGASINSVIYRGYIHDKALNTVTDLTNTDLFFTQVYGTNNLWVEGSGGGYIDGGAAGSKDISSGGPVVGLLAKRSAAGAPTSLRLVVVVRYLIGV